MLASLLRTATRSVIEPVGVGTRIEMPSSLPLSSGSTRPIAFAAPVELGMIDSAAARMRRRSGLPERVAVAWSCSCWSLVYACTVVMRPCSMPNVSFSTLASGARQFVVHDAFEMTVCCAGVVRLVVHAHADRRRRRRPTGAEMMTRLAPPFRCAAAFSRDGEEAGRLDHDVDAVVGPRDLRRLALLELLDLATVDREAGVGCA